MKKFLSGLSIEKKRKLIVILGVAGIVMIFLSNYVHIDNNQGNTTEQPSSEPLTVEKYRNQLEEELTAIVSAIDGTGNVHILITMDSTIEDVYVVQKNVNELSDEDSDDNEVEKRNEYKEDNEYVIIKTKDGSEQAILQKQVMPKIRGVLIVCDGGGNSVVQEKVTKAVSGVLNISTGKVYVTD